MRAGAVGFEAATLGRDEEGLRAAVRSFLAEELPPGSHLPGLGMDAEWSPAFSEKLAERGWLGMAIPR
ncbi:MAG TPA: acyl-CoA dehydrogenase family protein, partial [Acidimicrobiales bacterium]|nr:acyl-CoA dehydrogenase family protein [Acidimicrobiales bacterium]